MTNQDRDRQEMLEQLAVGLLISLMMWTGPMFVLVLVAILVPQQMIWPCVALIVMTVGFRSMMLAACKSQLFGNRHLGPPLDRDNGRGPDIDPNQGR